MREDSHKEKPSWSILKKPNVSLPDQSEDFKKKNHEHVIHCAQGLKIFKNKEPPKDIIQLGNNEIVQKINDDKKLLVLDMDETLMHTVHHFEDNNIQWNDVNKDYQYLLPIKNQHGIKIF